MALKNCSVILAAGSPAPVIEIMAKLFNIDKNYAAQVCKAAPIVIISGLTSPEARGAITALSSMTVAGAKFSIITGSTGATPKVGWGGIPKISGKPANSFAKTDTGTAAPFGSLLACPCCGARLKLIPDQETTMASGALTPKPIARTSSGVVALKRPVTNSKTKTTSPSGSVRITKSDQVPVPPQPGEVKISLGILDDLPDVPDIPDIPVAGHTPPPAKPSAQPAPVDLSSDLNQLTPELTPDDLTETSPPIDLADFEAGLSSTGLSTIGDDGAPNVKVETVNPVPAPRSPSPLDNNIVTVQGLDSLDVNASVPVAAPKAVPKAAPKAPAPPPAAAPKAAAKAPPKASTPGTAAPKASAPAKNTTSIRKRRRRR